MWLGVDLRTDNKKNVFNRDWTTCSNMLNILSSIVNINWEDLYDHLMNTGNFTLIMSKIFIRAPQFMSKWLRASFGFASHLTLIAYFISYKKWVQREKCPNNTRLPYLISMPSDSLLRRHAAIMTSKITRVLTHLYNCQFQMYNMGGIFLKND